MNDGELLAYMYDFYNEHTLKNQNEDIDFYIKFIKKYKCKNVLIVGAGTGRVANPLSKYCNITALDMDKYRLERLHIKNRKVETINCNFLDYIKTGNSFDLIIFPYSTIQFISGNKSLFDKMIKKLSQIANNRTNILLDFSENFNTKDDISHLLLFKDYSAEINDFVEVFYSAKKYRNYIHFIVEYHLVNKKYSVFEDEKYEYYNENKIKKILKKYNFNILNISNGYGFAGFESKHIYHIIGDKYAK